MRRYLPPEAFPVRPRFLHDVAGYHTKRIPDQTALIFGDSVYSWREFYDRIRRLAYALQAFGKIGDRVAIISETRPEAVECLYGIPAAGRVAVPINFRFTPKELLSALKDAEPSVIIVQGKYAAVIKDLLEQTPSVNRVIVFDGKRNHDDYEDFLQESRAVLPTVKRDTNDTAWIMYTSGTSGMPRGAMLSHKSLLLSMRQVSAETLPGYLDRMLYCLPLFHVAAVSLFVAHYAGGTVVLMDRFAPADFMRHLEKYAITVTVIVPMMGIVVLRHLKTASYDTKSLKIINYLGDKMPPMLLRALIHQFGHIIRPGGQYGMTELAGSVLRMDRKNYFRFYFYWKFYRRKVIHLVTATGTPYPDVRLKVIDQDGKPCGPDEPGELLVKSGQVMKGYWRNPKATAEVIKNGWLHTGDIVKYDRDGFYYVLERKRDLIITGGENVFPSEVEAVLYRHPAVYDAAVIGMPDEKWGEKVTAVVVLRHSKKDFAEEKLKNFMRNELAGYKVPKRIIFTDSLPRNMTGKILKQQLREQYSVKD